MNASTFNSLKDEWEDRNMKEINYLQKNVLVLPPEISPLFTVVRCSLKQTEQQLQRNRLIYPSYLMTITSIATDHLHESCPITLNSCHVFPLQFTKHIFRSCQTFPHGSFSCKEQIKQKIKNAKMGSLALA